MCHQASKYKKKKLKEYTSKNTICEMYAILLRRIVPNIDILDVWLMSDIVDM